MNKFEFEEEMISLEEEKFMREALEIRRGDMRRGFPGDKKVYHYLVIKKSDFTVWDNGTISANSMEDALSRIFAPNDGFAVYIRENN